MISAGDTDDQTATSLDTPITTAEVDDVFEQKFTLDGSDTAGAVEAIRALDLDLFLLGACRLPDEE